MSHVKPQLVLTGVLPASPAQKGGEASLESPPTLKAGIRYTALRTV